MPKKKRILGEPIDYDVPHDVLYMPSYSRDDDILLCVNRAGIVSVTPPFFHIRRYGSYRYSVVHCVTRGSGTVILRDREHRVERGQLFLISAGEAHEYMSDPDDPLGLCWVEIYGGDSRAMLQCVMNNGNIVLGGEAFQNTLSLCTEIIMRLEHPGQVAEISVLIYQMLVELLKASGTIALPGHNPGQTSGFREILDYIGKNLDKNLTIEVLAEKFNYNPTYLARKFASEFGTPPARYILRQRLIRSYRLLLGTNLPLDEIASKTGFYDASHFVSKFKQSEGITPLAYRKQNRGLVPPPD